MPRHAEKVERVRRLGPLVQDLGQDQLRLVAIARVHVGDGEPQRLGERQSLEVGRGARRRYIGAQPASSSSESSVALPPWAVVLTETTRSVAKRCR